jgi:hypothetical protein
MERDSSTGQLLAGPWQWLPDMDPWFVALQEQARTWQPSVALTLDESAIAQAVCQAAEVREPWLFHPCLGGITHNHQSGRPERDVALVGWLALHTPLEGELKLGEQIWCWSEDGGFVLNPGTHSLHEVGNAMTTGRGPAIALDPWCTILGYPHPDSWPAGEHSLDAQADGVRRGTLVALRSYALLEAFMPATARWLQSLAKLLIFLDGPDNLSRSSSTSDLPGVIFADATSEIGLLEVLVHEAAHQLLFITEAGGPLIDPADNRRFASPLRPEPRPLRGILLAYHALAYICALYADLGRSTLGEAAVDRSDMDGLRSKLDEAEATLHDAAESLTDRGVRFVRDTHEVSLYA